MNKMARKMAAAHKPRKATARKTYPQVGKSNRAKDAVRKAKPAGWRKSAGGKWYFENRRNRSDKHTGKSYKGKWL